MSSRSLAEQLQKQFNPDQNPKPPAASGKPVLDNKKKSLLVRALEQNTQMDPVLRDYWISVYSNAKTELTSEGFDGDGLQITHDALGVALDAARSWIDGVSDGKAPGLVLWSNGYGCGKTHIAQACGKHIKGATTRRGESVATMFTNTAKFFDDLRDTYGRTAKISEGQFWANLFTYSAYIMDDIGAESVKEDSREWAQEKYFRLLDACYNRRAIIITTNLPPTADGRDSLEHRIGARAFDRLVGMCGKRIINLSAVPSFRLKQAGL